MVYLIHFEKKFKHALHYIGFSKDELFDKRIECHTNNRGSCLMTAVNKAGIKWFVSRTWPDKDGNFERMLKNKKGSKHLCPICNFKKIKNMTQQEIAKLPTNLLIDGDIETREIHINGTLLRPELSQKIHNHSPDGFNWGYGGSGPAQLALAILLKYLPQNDAKRLYQSFKFKVVASWPQTDFEKKLNLRDEISKLVDNIEDDVVLPDEDGLNFTEEDDHD